MNTKKSDSLYAIKNKIRGFSLLFLLDEVLSENFLDYKNRGVNGSHKGQIVWKIEASSYFVERMCIFVKHAC